MLSFKVDMESEALLTLSRLANLPTTRLARFAGRLAASQVKTEVYPEEWSKKVSGDSGWQEFKDRMARIGKSPGFLTGSAYSGIQVISFDQYGATVGLRGWWPSQFTTMPKWATMGKPTEAAMDYSDLDNFITQAEAFMTEEEREILADMGLNPEDAQKTYTVSKPVEKGLIDKRGRYRTSRKNVEFITVGPSGITFGMTTKLGGYYIEKSIPSEDLSTKSFGTARKGGSYAAGAYEKQTPAVDFMYLRASDADVIMDGVGRAIDMVMRASIREIQGTALVKAS